MTLWRRAAGSLPDTAFFAGFLAFAAFAIDPRLIYHWQAPAFYLTFDFLREFLTYPGGIVDGLYALLAQTYRAQIPGALVLTAEAAAAAALTVLCCGAKPLLRFISPILLLCAANRYYDRAPVGLALIAALAAAAVLVRRDFRPAWLSFLLLAPLYYTGGMAIVFLTAIGLGADLARRRYVFAAGRLVAAVALIAAVEWSHALFLPSSARDWFSTADVPKAILWWSMCAFCVLAGAAGQVVLPAFRARWASIAASIVITVALASALFWSYRVNTRDRRLAALDYYTGRASWPEVIAASADLPIADFNSLTRYEINLALHESNRLGDEMFRFPQAGSTIPRLRAEAFLPYMIRITDLLLRLGRVNDAEHFGSEAVVVGQSDPRILRLMAEIATVKGQTGAARKILNVLSREAGAGSWARRRLLDLDADSELSADGQLQLLRRRALRQDDMIPVWQNPALPDADVNRLLLDQLDQDPTNRLAFEFLMGNYLLARDLQSAHALMPRIRFITGPGYVMPDGRRRTPRHYQEAMAMWSDASGQPVQIEGVEIEPDTLNGMAVFKRLISQSPGRDAAMQAAWTRFRHTYFFYFVFGPGDYR